MDVFEQGIFYGTKLHPNKAAYAMGDEYANATGGKKAQGNYESEYRARYTSKSTIPAMRSTIQALQGDLERVRGKKCPKETLGKAILTGGIANLPARKCHREVEARANAISNVINEYQDRLQGMIDDEKAKAAAKIEEDKNKAMPLDTPVTDMSMQPQTESMIPSGSGMNTKTLLLIGGGVAGLLIIVMLLKKQG